MQGRGFFSFFLLLFTLFCFTVGGIESYRSTTCHPHQHPPSHPHPHPPSGSRRRTLPKKPPVGKTKFQIPKIRVEGESKELLDHSKYSHLPTNKVNLQ